MTKQIRILLSGFAVFVPFGVFCVGMYSPVTFLITLGFIALIALLYGWFGKPKILGNVMLLVISFGLTVIVAELVLRATLTDYLYYRPHEMLIQLWPRFPQVARYKAKASISRETFGDLAAMSKDENLREKRDIVFVTDSYGFRNKPLNEDPVYDVLILGDSVAVGNGTTQERTWVSLLSSRYNLQVYNLAIPGGPWQSYVNLSLEIERLNIHPGASIVLAIFSGNDLDEPYGLIETKGLHLNSTVQAAKVSLSTYRNRSALRQLIHRFPQAVNSSRQVLVRKIFDDGRKLLFYVYYVARKDLSKRDILKHKNYSHLEQTLHAIKKIANSKSVTFKIILVPSKAEIYSWVVDGSIPWSASGEPSGFSTVLREFCQSNAIEFLDLKPFLVTHAKDVWKASEELLWWSDDTHWNVKGHDVVADIVYENLLKLSRALPNQTLERTR